jgi:hypothetical protein
MKVVMTLHCTWYQNFVHICMSVCNAGFHYVSVLALGVNSHDCWSHIIWWDLILSNYKWNWVGLFNDNLRLNCKCLGNIITYHSSIIWYLIYVKSEVNWKAIFVYASHIWNFMIESLVVYQCLNGLSVLIEVSYADPFLILIEVTIVCGSVCEQEHIKMTCLKLIIHLCL